jgi:5-methyltetrahydropteroyltriglutamate--homocysteine methyltransferase
MSTTHNLGFPRIGTDRELKKALEAYWQGTISETGLEQVTDDLKQRHWKLQLNAGIDLVPVGDFSLYDHILDMSCLLGVVPPRFNWDGNQLDHTTYFAMARGVERDGQVIAACEMTKWFDTNYHYIVPEIHQHQHFKISSDKLFKEVDDARQAGVNAKPVIPGPLTWLWLAKVKGDDFNKLELLDELIAVYAQIIERLQQQGVTWVQIDEPILVLDLPAAWQSAFEYVYSRLQVKGIKRLLATYFGGLGDNLYLTSKLAIDGLHIDVVRDIEQVRLIADHLPSYKVLSLGIVDGRNIWRCDLDKALTLLKSIQTTISNELWIAPSCSLLHVPIDLENETKLDNDIKTWLAFAKQKLSEVKLLQLILDGIAGDTSDLLLVSRAAQKSRQASTRIHNSQVKQRQSAITQDMVKRNKPYEERRTIQHHWLKLPLYPTTTIGSFPQTRAIRTTRREYKQGRLDEKKYNQLMQQEIAHIVKKQQQIGLDVLVHGEPERNDMVEYFGELLQGFAFTQNGWVQSYGSRCVKPPIIFGDVARSQPMTVNWITYAQSCTDKPMKGMLTGPVTILNWSFVRDDQPRSITAEQIALALRDEVDDLEQAGISIIQIDEAALREGLPLRKKDWHDYLQWTVRAFRLSSAGVQDKTQIHTHMCYAEFNDIIEAIADMDADVITIETSRSDMELLDAFKTFDYPNEIGPGIYDIHSANIPTSNHMVELIKKATQYIPGDKIWINPDCGLKTRQWPEVEAALTCMVNSAIELRANQSV